MKVRKVGSKGPRGPGVSQTARVPECQGSLAPKFGTSALQYSIYYLHKEVQYSVAVQQVSTYVPRYLYVQRYSIKHNCPTSAF